MFNPSPRSALDALAAEYHLDQTAYVVVEKFLNLKPEYQQGVIEYFKAVAAALNESPGCSVRADSRNSGRTGSELSAGRPGF